MLLAVNIHFLKFPRVGAMVARVSPRCSFAAKTRLRVRVPCYSLSFLPSGHCTTTIEIGKKFLLRLTLRLCSYWKLCEKGKEALGYRSIILLKPDRNRISNLRTLYSYQCLHSASFTSVADSTKHQHAVLASLSFRAILQSWRGSIARRHLRRNLEAIDCLLPD